MVLSLALDACFFLFSTLLSYLSAIKNMARPNGGASLRQVPAVERLPDELRIMIAKAACQAVFRHPCLIRRHIMEILRSQHLMGFKSGHGVSEYLQRWYDHDKAIRRDAFRDMDEHERSVFSDICKRLTKTSLTNKLAFECRLLAMKEWLNNPPMDFRAFKEFLAHAEDRQSRVCTESIEIELCSLRDITDPPIELDDSALVTIPLRAYHRSVLLNAIHPPGRRSEFTIGWFNGVFRRMVELWVRELHQLPDTIKHVYFIHDIPMLDMPDAQPRSHWWREHEEFSSELVWGRDEW